MAVFLDSCSSQDISNKSQSQQLFSSTPS